MKWTDMSEYTVPNMVETLNPNVKIELSGSRAPVSLKQRNVGHIGGLVS